MPGTTALTAWTVVSTTGLALGVVRISPHATLRFLLAILVLVFLAMVLNYVDRQVVSVLKPVLKETFGMDDRGYATLGYDKRAALVSVEARKGRERAALELPDRDAE